MSAIDRDVFLYGSRGSLSADLPTQVDASLHLRSLDHAGQLVAALAAARDPVVVLGGPTPDEPSFALLRDLAARFAPVELVVVLRQPWVDVAVDAIKHGARDVWVSPLTSSHFERLVKFAGALEESAAADVSARVAYGLDRARHLIAASRLDEAERCLRAVLPHMQKLAPVLNLLGVIRELLGDVLPAQAFYRAALDFRGDYRPAWGNLQRTAQRPILEPPWLGGEETDA